MSCEFSIHLEMMPESWVFAKPLKAGCNVDGFGLSEARIERNGSISGQSANQFSNGLEICEKFLEE